MNDLKIYIPFNKKNEDKKEVGGYASTEALDSQGEIVEKEAIANALPGYLGDFDSEKGRYRFGNVREMHQMSAVGKTMKAKIDNKGLYVDAKIVDNGAWDKVKEGVYAGFSIGGRIVKQVKNRIKAIKLSEISLVDRPANPEAVFAMVKIDKKGRVKDMQKQGDMVADSMPESMPYDEILEAARILILAKELRWMYREYKNDGKSTRELENSLKNLRALAVKVLRGEERKKFNEIFEGDSLLKQQMEVPTIPHEEVLAAAHILDLARDIRMLLSLFEDTGKPTRELERALTALKTLASKILRGDDKKKFDKILYELDIKEFTKYNYPEEKIKKSRKPEKQIDISKHIDSSWAPGYFKQQRKVLG